MLKKRIKGNVISVLVTPILAWSPDVKAPSGPTAAATSTGPTAASGPAVSAPSVDSQPTGAAATPHTA
jgi:hypothetical protein